VIIKILFPSALSLTALPLAAHFLISHLFQLGLFLVLGRNFFTTRVFLVGLSTTVLNDIGIAHMAQVDCINNLYLAMFMLYRL